MFAKEISESMSLRCMEFVVWEPFPELLLAKPKLSPSATNSVEREPCEHVAAAASAKRDACTVVWREFLAHKWQALDGFCGHAPTSMIQGLGSFLKWV